MKLIQKNILKGTRTFELTDDMVEVRLKSLFKEEKLTVMLTILSPEPVENGPFLEFHSRVKCDPLISLLIDEPNKAEFNAFVDELKQRARREYNAFAGLKTVTSDERLAGNVYDEPPEFDTPDQMRSRRKSVDVEKIQAARQMLEQYLDADDIRPLLNALDALIQNPHRDQCFDQLLNAFDELGPRQGAVLTYAPYISLLLSDEAFE